VVAEAAVARQLEFEALAEDLDAVQILQDHAQYRAVRSRSIWPKNRKPALGGDPDQVADVLAA